MFLLGYYPKQIFTSIKLCKCSAQTFSIPLFSIHIAALLYLLQGPEGPGGPAGEPGEPGQRGTPGKIVNIMIQYLVLNVAHTFLLLG